MRRFVLLLLALSCGLALPLSGCIATDSGDVGYYSAPCSGSFYDIMLCARETGGADPVHSSLPGTIDDEAAPYTCRDACEQFVSCGLFPSDELSMCISSCLDSPDVTQPLLDCIRDNGCDINQCFESPE